MLPPAPSQPPPQPERHPLEEYGQLEPQMQPENLWALPLDGTAAEAPVDLDAHQPPVQRQRRARRPTSRCRRGDRRAPTATMIRIALVLVLILVVAGLWSTGSARPSPAWPAASWRCSESSGAPPPPREAATPARPKITDRIGQPSPQPSSGPPVAQRVVLYEEEPDDPQGKRFIGTVLWRTEMRPATPGRPPELAVRADIEVPERKMSVTLSLRRNTDQSLPASHTIEIVFTLPADSPSGGVQKVPGVLMKQAEQTRGVPLAGLAVPVTPGYFLIGLSSLESRHAAQHSAAQGAVLVRHPDHLQQQPPRHPRDGEGHAGRAGVQPGVRGVEAVRRIKSLLLDSGLRRPPRPTA